jgi:hypothetical protein
LWFHERPIQRTITKAEQVARMAAAAKAACTTDGAGVQPQLQPNGATISTFERVD